jgi:hypothetical protein
MKLEDFPAGPALLPRRASAPAQSGVAQASPSELLWILCGFQLLAVAKLPPSALYVPEQPPLSFSPKILQNFPPARFSEYARCRETRQRRHQGKCRMMYLSGTSVRPLLFSGRTPLLRQIGTL